MFNNIFSFEGRIRRTEYGISFIILVLARVIISFMLLSSGENIEVIFFILMLPVRIFFFAQGAKRCHDVNLSGWYQLIPFMPLYLIFGEGNADTNRFGSNPKLETVNF